jgi:hypothetical protein
MVEHKSMDNFELKNCIIKRKSTNVKIEVQQKTEKMINCPLFLPIYS